MPPHTTAGMKPWGDLSRHKAHILGSTASKASNASCQWHRWLIPSTF
jgi:hypothetical protein